MASAAKRRSARKRDSTTQRDQPGHAASSTPSRPAKRRKRVSIAMPADPDPETEDNDELADESDDAPELTEEADRVIPYLQEADYTALATVEYPNSDEDTVSAYAKIAGQRWTYYVRGLSINIGRAPDKEVPQSSDGFPPVNGSRASPGAPDQAHIDLGPSKLVSRLHATVSYSEANWFVEVKGRNGIKINGQLLKRTQRRVLISGDVVEIAGTEMMFVTPSVPVHIHEMYLGRLQQHTGRHAPKRPRRLTTERSSAQPEPPKFQRPTHISPYAPPGAANQGQEYTRPTTPPQGQGLLSAPYLAQHANVAPSYENHMTVENNDQVDYASDAFKDVKPPMSYATLIAQAILSTAEYKLSLSGIYEWIQSNFAYYRHNDGGWQNSIRHNLSLSPDFVRLPREAHEPGKGGLWRIADDKKDDYIRKGMKITSRGGARQTSNPNTPAPKRSPKRSPRKRTPPPHALPPAHYTKTSPSLTSPAVAPYPHASAETPSRAPRASSHHHPPTTGHDDAPALPALAPDAPTPARAPLRAAPYLAQSAPSGSPPPPLPSSGFYPGEAGGGGGGGGYQSLYTPAPQRREPSFAPVPSTGRLPSHYLPQSSPFPFWKEAGAAPPPGGTTPGAGLLMPDTSPLKGSMARAMGKDREKGEEGGGLLGHGLGLQSSSPPPRDVGNGSPTRPKPVEPRMNGIGAQGNAVRRRLPTPPGPTDEEGTLDLMGNFPAIGARRATNAAH